MVMQHSLLKRMKKRWQIYVFLLLPLLYIFLFSYVPMGGVMLAFKKFNPNLGILRSPWVGLANFRKFFMSYMFQRVVVNTLRVSIYTLLAGFPLPIVFALGLNVVQAKKFKKLVQTVTYMPHFISVVVIVGMLIKLFSPLNGLYPMLWNFLGNAGSPPDLLASPNAFVHMYVWSGVWQEFGWGSIIYLAAITGIAVELYEAAEIDGASRLQIIRYVIFPSILPVVSIQFILQLGGILNAGFDQVFNLYNDVVMVTGDIIDTYVYRVGLTGSLRYSQATAIGLFKNVIGLILVVGTNMIVRRIGEGEYKIW